MKDKQSTLPKDIDRPPAPAYAASPASLIAGQAYINEVDMVASEMEAKWGVDRLRLLVGPDLRIKFDRQRYLLNHAIWHGELEEVQMEAKRMCIAWHALDREADRLGVGKLQLDVWEVGLEDGSVAAIVRPNGRHARVEDDGRNVKVYTLEEIGRLLSAFPDIAKAKEVFPGATVTAVNASQLDPLHALRDSDVALDDDIPVWGGK